METVATLPYGRALTVDDLDVLPDDGHRYELIDGILIVSPSPRYRHQVVCLELAVVLRASCPDDMRVLAAPFDVVLAEDTCVVPDLLVARRRDFTEKNLPIAPLLAVEILSPSTRLIDLNVKRDRYRRAGVASYWVIDPDEPRLTGWELREGEYVEVADVSGHASWTATVPYRVTIVPVELLR